MNKPYPPLVEPNPRGCAGIAALLFAASPSVALGLYAISEYERMRGRPGGGGPVAFGVPPIWLIWLILLGVSLPWIMAGVLLLRRIPAGRWIALVLTLPTALLTALTGSGAIIGMNARDDITAQNVSLFGPIALGGMLFCLTVWVTEYVCRSNLTTPLSSDRQTPS
jgi:hypothetical protein